MARVAVALRTTVVRTAPAKLAMSELGVKRRPSGAADLGLFNFQQRTSEDCRKLQDLHRNELPSVRVAPPTSE